MKIDYVEKYGRKYASRIKALADMLDEGEDRDGFIKLLDETIPEVGYEDTIRPLEKRLLGLTAQALMSGLFIKK